MDIRHTFTGTKQFLSQRSARRGQGVVEYAGALVVAASIIAVVVANSPQGIEGIYTNVTTTIASMLDTGIANASAQAGG